MTPKTKAKSRTNTEVRSPARMTDALRTSTTIMVAAMNIRPPMVGVPCFDMCQVGPSSLMDCPAFSRRRAGMIPLPKMALITKPRTAAAAIFTKMESIGCTSAIFNFFFAADMIIAYSRGKRK